MKEMNIKKELICIDLDNTLIHSHKAHILAFQKALKKNKITNITNKQLEKKFGLSSKIFLKQLVPDITKKEIESIRKYHEHYLEKTKKYVHRIKGTLHALRELKKDYILALTTSSTKKDVDILLKKTKLPKSLFELIVPMTKNLKPKPAPDQIIKVEKKLKIKASFMVGDTIYDILAAKRAKVKAIAVTSGLQSKSTLKKAKPYAILKSIKYLPEYLKKIN